MSEPRELRPYVEYGPLDQKAGDFGAYPIPSETPDPAPKAVAAAAADFQDLVPTNQDQLPPPASSALPPPIPSPSLTLDLKSGHGEALAGPASQ